MKSLPRPTTFAWQALIVVAAWWIGMVTARQIAQINETSDQVPGAATDAASPTGYVRGTRNLLLPGGGALSQPWIMDLQRAAAPDDKGAARADYDNAPVGRPIRGAAPYRAWLRLVAGIERSIGGLPPGRAIERTALHADPALHILLCVGLGLFALWRFGAASGALLAAGIAALLAPTEMFAPGRPDDRALFIAVNLVAIILLLAGVADRTPRHGARWLALAGAAAGIGGWIDAGSELPVAGAVLVAGIVATLLTSRTSLIVPAWRAWAVGGAAVLVVGWWVEGRPGGLAGRDLGTVHPGLALAWLGAGEILVRAGLWRRDGAKAKVALALALVIVLVPLAWLARQAPVGHWLGAESAANTSGGSLWTWLRTEGFGARQLATLLPLLILPLACGRLRANAEQRFVTIVAVTAAVVLLLLAAWQLQWWSAFTLALLGVLMVVVPAADAGFFALGWRTTLGVLLVPALAAGWPRPQPDDSLAPADARLLVERDLAQWLSARSEPGTIAFAPPALSASLCYYGGLHVVTSPYRGNDDGRAFAQRLAAVSSTDEAQALVQRRQIRYVVLPSWDDTLDALARSGSDKPERSLIALLRQWLPPRWLRPVSYQMPVIPGLERDSLAVFEVVEPQENVAALSRLAEYFVETGRLDLAAAVGDSLAQAFAADAGAMIARAQVALARKESRTLARILPELLPAIADGKDEDLPWERRVSLAIVMAQAKQPDIARAQTQFCVQEADSERLRSLGPVALFRFLSLAHTYHAEFADPRLRDYAFGLLPPEFQGQLRP